MYIISKFNDYYDPVVSLGIDKTIVYKRDTIDFPVPDNSFIKEYSGSMPDKCWSWVGNNEYTALPIIIGIAGKIFLCYKLEYKEFSSRLPYNDKIKFCYNSDDIIKFHQDKKLEKHLIKFLEKEKKKSSW